MTPPGPHGLSLDGTCPAPQLSLGLALCFSKRAAVADCRSSSCLGTEEEDTCVSYEEEDTCVSYDSSCLGTGLDDRLDFVAQMIEAGIVAASCSLDPLGNLAC